MYPSGACRTPCATTATRTARAPTPHALVEPVGLDRPGARQRGGGCRGGEKQRLSLALALAAEPEVAFLDEPTSGVDVNGRDTIRGIVRDLAAGGCAVVLATHELDEAERLADRVVIFDRGTRGRRRHARRAAQRPRRDPLPQHRRPRPGGARPRRLGIAVAERRRRRVRRRRAAAAALIARLGGWLAEHGHPLARSARRRAAPGRRVPPPHRRDDEPRHDRRRSLRASCAPRCTPRLRNGEQLLLTLGIPVLLLVFFSLVDVLPTAPKTRSTSSPPASSPWR